jgi:hypothetical protein
MSGQQLFRSAIWIKNMRRKSERIAFFWWWVLRRCYSEHPITVSLINHLAAYISDV